MSDQTMTVWGFWITVAGTAFGLFSLLLAFYISNNTRKIKKNLMKKHLQDKYRKSKKTIMLQLATSYSLLKENNYLDVVNIDECIISLQIYDDILSSATKKKIKKLTKEIGKEPQKETTRSLRDIRVLMYEIYQQLQNDLDEHTEYLKEITK